MPFSARNLPLAINITENALARQASAAMTAQNLCAGRLPTVLTDRLGQTSTANVKRVGGVSTVMSVRTTMSAMR